MGLTTITVEELGPKGDGISRQIPGFRGRAYIERAIPGDRVRARLFMDPEGVARGEIVHIMTSSPNRQSAPCIHYDRCGNCTLQHLNPAYYREWKIAMVKDAFRRRNVKPQNWIEPTFVGSGKRRRATFSAVKRNGKLVLGYYRRRSSQITNIESCLVADPKLLVLRDAIKPFIAAIVSEDPLDIFLQLVSEKTDMVMTGRVGRYGKPDEEVKKALAPLMEMAPITRISWRASEKDRIQPLFNRGEIDARFGAITVRLPPAAFLQPTEEGERDLVKVVLSALPKKGTFADLFSGCGTFTGSMLLRGDVDAYELSQSAVRALAQAALVEPLRAYRRDLFKDPLTTAELNQYDAVVFDPPRGGCPEQAVEMASSSTRVLVGISCNPATFARDARILCDGGYQMQSLQIVDQFLWSHHVELVGVFTKSKPKRPNKSGE